jgi:uncharacterized protein (TIGR02678 family)
MSRRGSVLSQRVDAAVADERRQSMRALLMHPLITAAGMREVLALVRRHGDWLREWFAHHAGWHLHIDAEVARLNKTPATLSATHAALDQHDQPFTRRRYVLFCLALASLERSGRQITLRRLAEDLLGQIAGDPVLIAAGIELDTDRREDRGDLVAIGRYLVGLQVIARVHGDEESYLSASGDCLYAVRRGILARMLATRVGPSQIVPETPEARLNELQRELPGEGEEARNHMIRIRLVRHLLECPVLYEADLDQEQRLYLRTQRPHLLKVLTEATGLVAEIRAEGIALVDPERELTDDPLPVEGTDGHAALLIAGWMVDLMRADPGVRIPIAAVESQVARYAAANKLWRRDTRTAEGSLVLSGQLIDSFIALDLVRRERDVIVPLPALARFGLAEEAEAVGVSAFVAIQQNLFEPT